MGCGRRGFDALWSESWNVSEDPVSLPERKPFCKSGGIEFDAMDGWLGPLVGFWDCFMVAFPAVVPHFGSFRAHWGAGLRLNSFHRCNFLLGGDA